MVKTDVEKLIDPGHGGRDVGAIGNGIREKDWNLRMSLYQYNRLKQLGVKVGMTRMTDTYIGSDARGRIVRESGADMCISNHFNAFSDASANGVETIHSRFASPDHARKLAEKIAKTSGLHYRRVFFEPWGNNDYYFMHRLTGNVKTTIIEYGFLTNRKDANYYMNDANFYKVAESVVEVMCELAGVPYKSQAELEASVSVEKNTGSLDVALQDLKLTENEWKTQVVDVRGVARLKHNIHTYKGSPNFNDWHGLFDAGTEIEFHNMSIPFNSDLVWFAFKDRFTGETLQLPIGTVDDFNNGKLWVEIL